MSFSIRAGAVVAILVAGLAIAGCGETVIDQSKLNAEVEHDLETALPKVLTAGERGEELQRSLGILPHDKISSVDCPAEQTIDPGTTFTCSVEFSNGSQATETLKTRDKEADLTVVGLKPKK
jgi:hypothetical protein